MIRVGVSSILCGITAVAVGFVLKSPAIQSDAADIGLPVQHSRISDFGADRPDIFWPQASIKSQARVDQVRVASLGSEVASLGSEVASLGSEVTSLGSEATSDAVSRDQDSLKAIPASAWWNESFDERFPGLATRVLTRDVDFLSLPDDDDRTAIYDIAARTVYLPNGRRLEAHSGFGSLMDNPRHVHVKMRGATPPNVYNLSLRERLFHGVRAIRLTPVDESKMYGRDGMLAHSYLHGPNGQSSGCVAFSNYPAFLNAFLKGDVTRLIVVERLENPPERTAALGGLRETVRNLTNPSDRVGRYAAAGVD